MSNLDLKVGDKMYVTRKGCSTAYKMEILKVGNIMVFSYMGRTTYIPWDNISQLELIEEDGE